MLLKVSSIHFRVIALIKGIFAMRQVVLKVAFSDTVSSSTQRRQYTYFWLVVDEVVDPQTFGALIRFLDGSKIGLVVCAKNSAPPSPVVSAASAGALKFLDVVYSTSNLPKTLANAREDGFRTMEVSLPRFRRVTPSCIIWNGNVFLIVPPQVHFASFTNTSKAPVSDERLVIIARIAYENMTTYISLRCCLCNSTYSITIINRRVRKTGPQMSAFESIQCLSNRVLLLRMDDLLLLYESRGLLKRRADNSSR
jgi:hypothetical protein